MHRILIYVVLPVVFASASAATARCADNNSPSRKAANEPAAKSDNSGKSEAREGEKGAANSELQDLRDLVQSQSEELQNLRNRLTALEVGRTPSKEVAAPTVVSTAGNPGGNIETSA